MLDTGGLETLCVGVAVNSTDFVSGCRWVSDAEEPLPVLRPRDSRPLSKDAIDFPVALGEGRDVSIESGGGKAILACDEAPRRTAWVKISIA